MRTTFRYFRLLFFLLFVVSVIFLLLPWSARFRHGLQRVIAKAEMKQRQWRGYPTRLVSIIGDTGIPGAQVQILDSASGWAALCDAQGRFVIPDVVWQSGLSYDLFVSSDEQSGNLIALKLPSMLPSTNVIDAGTLDVKSGAKVNLDCLPGANFLTTEPYDLQNREYYRDLYVKLTSGKTNDEEKLAAINQYVAEKLNYNETNPVPGSPRSILERGSQFCGHLSAAMAALTVVGYTTRIVDIRDEKDPPATHVVVEIFYKGKWHLYDPTFGVSFKNENNEIASYKELRLNPSLITPESFSIFHEKYPKISLDWMRPVYASGYHHVYLLTFRCSQYSHAWWAYPKGLDYVPAGGKIWLAAAGISPGTTVTYHIRNPASAKDELTFTTTGKGTSSCVLNEEESPPINLPAGDYEVFVDLQDGNIAKTGVNTPASIKGWRLGVDLKIR
jgi:hypothetical protein